MDRQFLQYYNVELQHIRQMAGEFAREYPKIAARLALDKEGKEICPDPFVERLLEGFAYLAARVHLKLDAEFPRFTQSVLETVYPDYLCPMPSMGVVRFEPDLKVKSLSSGFRIPCGTQIRTMPGRSDATSCTYRTAHDVTVWPVRLIHASYLDRNILSLDLPPHLDASAAFHLTFESTAELSFRELSMDSMSFYVHGSDSLPSTILEHLFAHGLGVLARDGSDTSKGWQRLPPGSLSPVGYAQDEALIPDTPATFEGYRMLMEYFAFPQRFLFFKICGLGKTVSAASGNRIELAIPLSQADSKLAPAVNASLFDLNCTPVVNLFEKRTDRIDLSDHVPEFHVVVDRTRPLDYEVFSILSVTGYGAHAGEEQAFNPFYLTRDAPSSAAGYFTITRKPRALTEKEKKFGKLSSYAGSEVYLNLVDSQSGPYASSLEQLGITALCTNRHLPIQISHGDRAAPFIVEFNGPVKAAQCLSGPTPPRPSFAMGETAWRLISHLSLNYLSLANNSEKEGAVALRELLKLYVDPSDRSTLKQVDGIRSVVSVPILRRIPSPGMITFARGLEVTVTFDEDAFAGVGIFVLGMVLEQFFARHVAINSFTETVIKSRQRGEIIRWTARTGRKQIL